MNKLNSSSATSNTTTNNHNRNNASPKWQPSYSSNIANSRPPSNSRPLTPIPPQLTSNSSSLSPSTSTSSPGNNRSNQIYSNASSKLPFGSLPQAQQQQSLSLPPPAQSIQLAPPPPLMPNSSSSSSSASKQIPSLMSTNFTNINNINVNENANNNNNNSNKLTPYSPTPTPQSPSNDDLLNDSGKLPDKKADLSSLNKQPNVIPLLSHGSTVQTSAQSTIPARPPDSPTNEAAPIVIPKLIPLERNVIGNDNVNSSASTSAQASHSQNMKDSSKSIKSNKIESSKLKSDAVDIASPDAVVVDEEDDDNLVIDLIQTNSGSATVTPVSSQTSVITTTFIPFDSEMASSNQRPIATLSYTAESPTMDSQSDIASTTTVTTTIPTTIPTSPSFVLDKNEQQQPDANDTNTLKS